MIRTTALTILILLLSSFIYAQNPAILELESTTQGFLPPVMTKAQMTAISSPVEGLTVYCKDCPKKGLHFFSGSAWIGPGNLPHDLAVTDIYNSATGKVWMDRNLGASQVATSSTDALAYGHLYQWGRGTDGHQIRTSGTNDTLSGSDTPDHVDFITPSSIPFDWRSPQNASLWQGGSGINNPCPTGYRLPTEAEWEAERSSWSSNNAAGAFASPLKLPMAGRRFYSSGSLLGVDSNGFCWSITVGSASSRYLLFHSSNAFMGTGVRAYGVSVRCLKG